MGIYTESINGDSAKSSLTANSGQSINSNRRHLNLMKISKKVSFYWLLLGPVAALLVSFVSWFVFEYFTPGKLSRIPEMVKAYPFGLLMSLLTPWGWLMYGGFLLMNSGKNRAGIWCSVGGAVLLGCFWPVWATFLNQ